MELFFFLSLSISGIDYPPGYFPDPSKKLSMQPDLTVNTSGGGSGGGTMNPMGLPLCYEYTYPGSGTTNKDNVPLTPGNQLLPQLKLFSLLLPFTLFKY